MEPAGGRGNGLLIGGMVIALLVIGGLLFALWSDSGDDESSTAEETAEVTEEAPTVEPRPVVETFGTLEFRTTNVLGDTAVLAAEGLDPAGAGNSYTVWLYNSQDDHWKRLGTLAADTFGTGSLTYTAPDGESMYQSYDGVALSVEASGTEPETPTEVRYSGRLPEVVANALHEILGEWSNTELNPREMSLFDIAMAEYGVGEDHANRALVAAERDSIGGARTHAEHAYNIMHGGETDINDDGSNDGNPSNLDIGLLVALEEMLNLLVAAEQDAAVSPELQFQVATVNSCVFNALLWTETALEEAQTYATLSELGEGDVSAMQNWYETIVVPIGPGMDADEDGIIEPIEGECGIEGMRDFGVLLNVMALEEGTFAE
jgi:hypothetical protein